MRDLFRGELVRLTAESPEAQVKLEARWQRDTEYHRLADDEPARMWSEKKHKERFEKRIEESPEDGYFSFSIRTLDTEQVIGVTMLRVDWSNAEAMIGIAIGERDHWGKGYGTDAIQLVMQFAFYELNLRRLTLGVNDYNLRAVRTYKKAGFQKEGVIRGDVQREGRHMDSIYMGLLREEWLARQGGAA
jgi:RimJ/RimL family protein N-acetyltransferase